MRVVRGLVAGTLLLVLIAVPAGLPAAAPADQIVWGVHFALAPTWFDPAETSGIITPFVVLYALHDAMLKPLPGNPMAPGPRRIVEPVVRRSRRRARPSRRR